MFRLFLCEESGEGDNVGLDLGILRVYTFGSHDEGLGLEERGINGWEMEISIIVKEEEAVKRGLYGSSRNYLGLLRE